MKKTTVLGFLGTKLDRIGDKRNRWQRWRPTVDLCRHQDFLIDRYELLYEEDSTELAEQVIADMKQVSPETEIIGRCLGITKPWDLEDVYSHTYDYLKQLKPDANSNNYYVNITTGTHISQIVLFILTESRHIPGKLLQISPPKGREVDRHQPGSMTIIDLDLSKYNQLAGRFAEEKEEAQHLLKSGIETKNKAFNKLIEQIEIVAARSQAPMLITGATGAGKSHLASKIYQLRADRNNLEGEFVEINCATLRGDTAMSSLFGHKKGAFTGAANERAGLLREAHKGILFLDEIGELGADEQAMLLRALEEGKWLPMGADKPVKSSFQLIAGTNCDLREEVVKGKFREDLLARINTWTFTLPGLAERPEDIEPNVIYELARHAEQTGQVVHFNTEALKKFMRFATDVNSPWLGNFRDLNAAITRMATLAPQGRIREEEVEQEIQRLNYSWQRPKSDKEEQEKVSNPTNRLKRFINESIIEKIDPFDRAQLAYTLEVCAASNSLSDAGRKLFSVSRAKRKSQNDSDRLRKYLAKFSIEWRDGINPQSNSN